MVEATAVAAGMALTFSMPRLPRCRIDVADQVCGALAKLGFDNEVLLDRGHYHIDATINSDRYEAWRVCPKPAVEIAAVMRQSNGSFGCKPERRSNVATACWVAWRGDCCRRPA